MSRTEPHRQASLLHSHAPYTWTGVAVAPAAHPPDPTSTGSARQADANSAVSDLRWRDILDPLRSGTGDRRTVHRGGSGCRSAVRLDLLAATDLLARRYPLVSRGDREVRMTTKKDYTDEEWATLLRS